MRLGSYARSTDSAHTNSAIPSSPAKAHHETSGYLPVAPGTVRGTRRPSNSCLWACSHRSLPGSTPTRPMCGKSASRHVLFPQLNKVVVCRPVSDLPRAGEVLIAEQLRKPGDLAETQ